MSYLRFSPGDYCAIYRACRPLAIEKMSLPIFKRVLVGSLSDKRPNLAERIAGLGEDGVRVIYDHLLERRRGKAAADRQPELIAEELAAVAEACQSFPLAARFMRYFKGALVRALQEGFPDLASKLSRLSGSEFERLYEFVKARRKGSP
jgi:hypothetical protein